MGAMKRLQADPERKSIGACPFRKGVVRPNHTSYSYHSVNFLSFSIFFNVRVFCILLFGRYILVPPLPYCLVSHIVCPSCFALIFCPHSEIDALCHSFVC